MGCRGASAVHRPDRFVQAASRASILPKCSRNSVSNDARAVDHRMQWCERVPGNAMTGSGNLTGFRVVDVTEGICGPFCSMQLGDASAEVIKIEPPQGDYGRRIGPPFVNGE